MNRSSQENFVHRVVTVGDSHRHLPLLLNSFDEIKAVSPSELPAILEERKRIMIVFSPGALNLELLDKLDHLEDSLGIGTRRVVLADKLSDLKGLKRKLEEQARKQSGDKEFSFKGQLPYVGFVKKGKLGEDKISNFFRDVLIVPNS